MLDSPRTQTAASLVRPEIAAMHGYAPGEQPQGGKWIKLNTNENPYEPSPAVSRAVAATSTGRTLAKYPDPLATAFRIRAADLLGVDPDWILCGNGSDDLLTILVRSFVGAGDRLRVPTPSYILYRTLADLQGAICDEVPFASDWSLDDRFWAPAERLRLAIIANPNSPSGTLIPPAEVLRIAEQLPCPLVVDEAYGDFADDDCLDLVKRCERVIVTRSLSKSYALAGLRFGFAVARPEIIQQLVKMKDSYNCDALSIAAATAAIDDQDWLHETLGRIIATRSRLATSLARLGFIVVASQANFVWCTHPTLPHRPIYESLKAEGILIRFMRYEGYGDGLRITVGTDDEIDAFLAALRMILGRATATSDTPCSRPASS
ncbi:MAG: histidinol-phosphate transaminase [Planctomycetaceae bacterium]